MTRKILLVALLASVALPSAAQAGGFGISEFSSRASGRGSAAVALADPSAIFYNPANITPLPGLQLSAGASLLAPKWGYKAPNGYEIESERGVVPPPHLSATYALGNLGFGDMAAGLGFYVPYGSTFSWPENWQERQSIQKIGLTVYEVAPVLALRPHKLFSVGAGFRYLPSSVYMKQAVGFGSEQPDGSVELGGSGYGLGASAGVSVFPTEGLTFSFAWRSPVTLKMKGQSDFEFAAPFDTEARDLDVETEVPLAQVFRIGAAWDILPRKLNVSFDVEYQMWSTFEELAIDFVQEGQVVKHEASPRDSSDSIVVHLGGEYQLNKELALRAGYIYDQHTVPEENVNPAPPDSDKHVLTLGASYDFGPVSLHGHVANVFFAPRTSNTSATAGSWRGGYPGGTMAYIAGLTASTQFDVAAPFGAAARAQ